MNVVRQGETSRDGIPLRKRYWHLRGLDQRAVTGLGEVKVHEVTHQGLTITTKEGQRQAIEADTVVPAMGFKPDTELLIGIEGRAPETYLVGDCREPGLIIEAIADGSRVARVM